MGFLDTLRTVLGDGWGKDVPRTGVRPDYGLSTVTGISPQQKSPFDRSFAPGEQATLEDVRSSLGEIAMSGMPVSGITSPRRGPSVAASGASRDRGLASQIRAEREIAKLRAAGDDMKYGYTNQKTGQKVAPTSARVISRDTAGMSEKYRGEVEVLSPSGTPVRFNIWADPDGNLYAQNQQMRTEFGYKDRYKPENLGEITAMKRLAIERFGRADD